MLPDGNTNPFLNGTFFFGSMRHNTFGSINLVLKHPRDAGFFFFFSPMQWKTKSRSLGIKTTDFFLFFLES